MYVHFQGWLIVLDSHLVCSSREKTIPHTQHFLVACISLSRSSLGTLGLSSTSTGKSIAVALVHFLIRQPCWWNFMDVALLFLGDKTSYKHLDSLILKSSWPPFYNNSCFNCEDCILEVFFGTGMQILHLNWLWFFVMVSVFCKEKLSRGRVKRTYTFFQIVCYWYIHTINFWTMIFITFNVTEFIISISLFLEVIGFLWSYFFKTRWFYPSFSDLSVYYVLFLPG